MNWLQLSEEIQRSDMKALARCISLVENEAAGYENFLQSLPIHNSSSVVGITGPPGAGKSTLTDALIQSFLKTVGKTAVICVDPSSPINKGALLGDRIRMNKWYAEPRVFIRSLASKGSYGGLHPKIIEITDILKFAGYKNIIIETVGVGQSEIEIAGLADTTVVVLVPEAGDDIQSMKAGLMEIADIFVVNKADRPGAESFAKNLKQYLHVSENRSAAEIPVLTTIALQNDGIQQLAEAIIKHNKNPDNHKKTYLLVNKSYELIKEKRMKDLKKDRLAELIKQRGDDFNLYRFINEF